MALQRSDLTKLETAVRSKADSNYLNSLAQWKEIEYSILSGLRLTEREGKRQTDKLELLSKQVILLQTATEQVATPLQELNQGLRLQLDQLARRNEQLVEELKLLASERHRTASELVTFARDQNISIANQLETYLSQHAQSWDAMEKLLLSLLAHPTPHALLARRASQGSAD
ncbi:MAG: hypothetical protein WKF37_14795 [Bryobacteraceae bacterium]